MKTRLMAACALSLFVVACEEAPVECTPQSKQPECQPVAAAAPVKKTSYQAPRPTTPRPAPAPAPTPAPAPQGEGGGSSGSADTGGGAGGSDGGGGWSGG